MKKIAVITGASSGMGRDFLRQISREEKFDEIWAIARREDRLVELSKEVCVPIRAIPLDLTDEKSFEVYKSILKEENPNVSLLVNASGFGKFALTEEISVEDSVGMVDLNCKAMVAITQLTLPYMKEGSHILQFGSRSSFQPTPYVNVYAATKAFVLSYSRALNVELKKRGIRVMATCPSWVSTEFFTRATTPSDNAINYYDKVYKSEDVIRHTIKDLYHTKKDVSIYGLRLKFERILIKLCRTD